MIGGALEQTRNLARGFSPVELGPDGLRAALKHLATTVGETVKAPCLFKCGGRPEVDDEAALHLYRIAQEALNNAVRHSKATEFSVSLQQSPRQITLCVRDNGVGFPAERRSDAGMGVSVMHYRASMIGATLEIRPGEPCGTVVTCVYAAQRSMARPPTEGRALSPARRSGPGNAPQQQDTPVA